MENNLNYRIVVNPYMLKKATKNFPFMKEKNNNVPMPERMMSGKVLSQTKGMVQMELRSLNGKTWTGFIPKSAILSFVCLDEAFSETVDICANQKGKTVVPIGDSVGMRSRTSYLIHCFPTNEIYTTKKEIHFSGLDFQDVCRELEAMNVTVRKHPGQIYQYGLVDELQVDNNEIFNPELFTPSTLYQYQKDGILFGLKHNSFLLGDDMGLGKTLQASIISVGKKELYGFKHCLVVCGVNSVKYNWKREVEKHTFEKGFVLAETGAAKLKQLQMIGQHYYSQEELSVMGVRDKKKAEQSNAINDSYFLIANVEAFRNQDFVDKIKELCQRGFIGGIIFDEMHKCINVTSQQAQGMLQISAPFKIGMTGTPLINRPEDAYFTFRWLEKTNLIKYAWDSIYHRKVDDFTVESRNLWMLRLNFERIMLRRKKEQVLDLPERIYTEELVELNAKQNNIYARIEDNVATEQPLNGAVKVMRLRQTTGIPDYVLNVLSMEGHTDVTSAKLERLAERVSEIIEAKEKVVIFSNWTEVLDRLPAYGIINALRIDGTVSPEERNQIQELWQSEEEGGEIEHPVIVGTIGAMGTGLNLNTATNVIFIDEPWTNSVKQQAVDRCHRVGTKNTVHVVTLLGKDTVDEEVHDVVLGKKTMAELLIDYGATSEEAQSYEEEPTLRLHR